MISLFSINWYKSFFLLIPFSCGSINHWDCKTFTLWDLHVQLLFKTLPFKRWGKPPFFETGLQLKTMSMHDLYHLKVFDEYNNFITYAILNGGSYGFDRNGLKTKIRTFSKVWIFVHARYITPKLYLIWQHSVSRITCFLFYSILRKKHRGGGQLHHIE